jgi:hypothetical protein
MEEMRRKRVRESSWSGLREDRRLGVGGVSVPVDEGEDGGSGS